MNEELEECLIQAHWEAVNQSVVEFRDGLYHYTSAEAFLNMVKPEGITFWASRIDCMNDKTEWLHAVEVYQKACSQLLEAGEIPEPFYQRIYEIKPTSEQLFFKRHKLEQPWQGWDGVIAAHPETCYRFTCCFSREQDSLPMWNYYSKSNDRNGYNLGFIDGDIMNSKKMYEGPFSYRTCKVIYDEDRKSGMVKEQIRELSRVIQTPEELEEVARELPWLLSEWAVTFKSGNFSYENEVRLIVDVPLSEAKENVKYRTNNGLIVPYIEMTFPREILRCVKIGPLSCLPDDEMLQKEIMKEMLSSRGYEDVAVSNSRVPIRF